MRFAAILVVLALSPALMATDVLIPRGATWRYLDDGSDQGSSWVAPAFNDSAWGMGPAHLGYGDQDEITPLSFGADPDDKHITTYFRHGFSVPNPAAYTKLRLRLARDDGAVVFLNGLEVARSNMPVGLIAFDTGALASQSGSDEDVFRVIDLSPSDLLPGNNLIAVEVHQIDGTSSDISFDLDLRATDKQFVIRGPYLQLGTSDSMVLRWNTDDPTDSVVRYGTAPGVLTSNASNAVVISSHLITLTGLAPATRYWYSVGSASDELAGPDATHTFMTAPLPGSPTPIRVWAIGDSGTADSLAASVRDAYANFTGSQHTDLWLMLGDNAYTDGTLLEYQNAVYDTYPSMLRQSVVWPTRGNHDTTGVYAGTFSLPSNGEAGGMPSGTELYYSFDYANVHFICLDSESSTLTMGGAMWTWLGADLASTNQDWVIAYWHHPPYTKGSHDSDTDNKLMLMRQNFLPLLEANGVDLVLGGHSHSFERSFLLDRHYGLSSSFVDSKKKDPGDGATAGDGAYNKAFGAHNGTVYCVAGSSGKTSTPDGVHPAMHHSEETLGSLVIDVDDLQLQVQFLDSTGSVNDGFTIQKGDFATWDVLGGGTLGVLGPPQLIGVGTQEAGSPLKMFVSQAAPNALGFLFLSGASAPASFLGGTLHAFPLLNSFAFSTDALGAWTTTAPWPSGIPSGLQAWIQAAVVDASVPVFGGSLSNGVKSTAP